MCWDMFPLCVLRSARKEKPLYIHFGFYQFFVANRFHFECSQNTKVQRCWWWWVGNGNKKNDAPMRSLILKCKKSYRFLLLSLAISARCICILNWREDATSSLTINSAILLFSFSDWRCDVRDIAADRLTSPFFCFVFDNIRFHSFDAKDAFFFVSCVHSHFGGSTKWFFIVNLISCFMTIWYCSLRLFTIYFLFFIVVVVVVVHSRFTHSPNLSVRCAPFVCFVSIFYLVRFRALRSSRFTS